jgi:ribosomal protein S18 acetylase RimI-like enzyme
MIRIRAATENDYDSILELWGRAGLSHEPHRRDSPLAFRQHLQLYGDCTFVAEADTKIIGTVLGTHDGRKGWINRLAVAREYQRHGLARQLIASSERAFRSKGIAIISALVEHENKPSCATFLKSGYVARTDVIYFRKEI